MGAAHTHRLASWFEGVRLTSPALCIYRFLFMADATWQVMVNGREPTKLNSCVQVSSQCVQVSFLLLLLLVGLGIYMCSWLQA